VTHNQKSWHSKQPHERGYHYYKDARHNKAAHCSLSYNDSYLFTVLNMIPTSSTKKKQSKVWRQALQDTCTTKPRRRRVVGKRH